jgi:hypothetical protein
LLKRVEVIKDVPIKTVYRHCPKKTIDAEIAKIVNEEWCAFDDLGAAGNVPAVTSDDVG